MTDPEEWPDDEDMTAEEREAETLMYGHFPYVVNEEGCYFCGSHYHKTADCDDEEAVWGTAGKAGEDKEEVNSRPDAQGETHE